MADVAMTDEPFEDRLEPPSIEIEDAERIAQYPLLKLKFQKEMAYRLYDEFDERDISPGGPDHLTVSVRMPEDGWLYGFLLYFGADVEVLEPIHIKSRLAKEAGKIVVANKKSQEEATEWL